MSRQLSFSALLTAIFVCQAAYAVSRVEATTSSKDQKEISLSIYNNNLALIKDTRRIRLMHDAHTLAWRGVSAQMRSETAQLHSLSGADNLRVQEQFFDFGLLSPQKLLEARSQNRRIFRTAE